MRKKILEQRLARLQAKKAKLVERCNASTDATRFAQDRKSTRLNSSHAT